MNRVDVGDGHRLSAAEDQPQGGQVMAFEIVVGKHSTQHRGNQQDRGDPMTLDSVREALRVEVARGIEHELTSRPQRGQGEVMEPSDPPQRRQDQVDIVDRDAELRQLVEGIPQHCGVSVHRSLGPTGSA